jgi:membrane protein
MAATVSPRVKSPNPAIAGMKALWKGMDAARSFGLAAEMAFWLFLSLIPLAAVAGLVASRIAFARWDVAGPAVSTLPPTMTMFLTSEMAKVAAWNGGAVAPVAALIFVWLASAGIHSVFDALEVQTGAKARPWWKKRLLAIASCVGLSIGIAALAIIGTGIDWAWKLLGSSMPAGFLALQWSAGGKLLRLALAAGIALGMLVGLYRVALPPAVRKTMPILPGAAFALLLHLLLGTAYAFYIDLAGAGDAYQAGLAVIGVTLMVLYFFCLAILAGAELNQVVGERNLRR